MYRKVFSAIMLTLLLIGLFSLAINVKPAKSEWTGTVYIRADGSIDPPDAPITTHDSITYILTGNITSSADGIIVEKNNIVIDGADYTLQGSGSGMGIILGEVSQVTIRNLNIENFEHGIHLTMSFNDEIYENNLLNNGVGIYIYLSSTKISKNNITENLYGIQISSTSDNYIIGNNITKNSNYGIWLESATHNKIIGNNVTSNGLYGIVLELDSNANYIVGNNISNNYLYGVGIYESYSNYIICNNITENGDYGIGLYGASNNIIYHNNFNNTNQIECFDSISTWDNGYPSGGNYWSDYDGIDSNGDGVGDTPYVIDEDNIDYYPLIRPYVGEPYSVAVTNLTMLKTVIGKGYFLHVNVTVANYGEFLESLNVVLCANSSILLSQGIYLESKASKTITFMWNTTGFVYGNYIIWAYVSPILGETETSDNSFIGGNLTVTISGDVDGNFEVDIFDITAICICYDSEIGEPLYQPNYDIDGNGIIDIYDLVTACINYGQKYP